MPILLSRILFAVALAGLLPSSMASTKVSLPATLLNADGEQVTNSMEGKFVGLYFSASWCGPCRRFTPELVSFRNQNADYFEVVLIGADGSSKAQQNYMKKYKMPWLALENQSREAKDISEKVKVEILPTLVILDAEGNLVSKKGKEEISKYGNESIKYWGGLSE